MTRTEQRLAQCGPERRTAPLRARWRPNRALRAASTGARPRSARRLPAVWSACEERLRSALAAPSGSRMATFGTMSVVVLVPGYGGRVRAVERWRIEVALRTLRAYGGGQVVVSGHRGEAERLAAITANQNVIIEPTAQSTRENVEGSIPFFDDAPHIAVPTDQF